MNNHHMRGKTYTQQEFFDERREISDTQLVQFLNDGARTPVVVKLTRNRVAMISVDFALPEQTKLRLHERFLGAPDEVLAALRNYLRGRRRSCWRIVSDFAQSIDAGNHPVKEPRTRTRGYYVDLKEVMDQVNEEHFGNTVKAKITWGRRAKSPGKRRRSIHYGSYSPSQNLIRIHPLLDDRRVPLEFIRYIVFHEMLHSQVPAVTRNGRTNHHPPEFNRREREYPEWRRMHILARRLLKTLSERYA
ncbi:MAG: hypothetical protein KJ626_03420 [Verrucomicrobia bacterium]|nr:hypothetical protein [Verrucomicrobiota bacterium]